MDPHVEIRHLRYFVAVAEELHFGRAALRLHLAQPALSQQIQRLEEIVGAPLLLRTSRSVRLSAAGEIFLERSRRTLRDVRLHVEEARGVARGESGFLNVGFIGSGMLASLPLVLQRYRVAYPLVTMHLHESFTSRVIAGLAAGTLDAGLLRDGDPHPELETETLFTEPYVAVLPAAHALARQKSVAAARLRDEPFVFYARSAGALAFDKPLSLCGGIGFRPRIVQEASNWLTIVRLIASGFGVSIAPACVAALAGGDVVCVPLRETDIVSRVELAYRKEEQRPIVRALANVARRVIRNDRRNTSAGRTLRTISQAS